MRLIVSDAGPLIALSRVNKLSLLETIFDEVVIPQLVCDELRLEETRPGVERLSQAIQEGKWLKVRAQEVDKPGLGECAAMVLAESLDCPLLVDERRGRAVARQRGIQVIGTGRVLLTAKERGLIPSVVDVLQDLRKEGYRLSDRLCRRLAELSGE